MKFFDGHAPNPALFLLFAPGCFFIVLSFFSKHGLPSLPITFDLTVDLSALIFFAMAALGGFFFYAASHEHNAEQRSLDILVATTSWSFAAGIKIGNEIPKSKNRSKRELDDDE